jgi:hypothetical protein
MVAESRDFETPRAIPCDNNCMKGVGASDYVLFEREWVFKQFSSVMHFSKIGLDPVVAPQHRKLLLDYPVRRKTKQNQCTWTENPPKPTKTLIANSI